MQTRRIRRALGSLAIALLLAGCFKVNINLDVAADDTVSGTAVIAVDESLLELSGQSVDDLFADMDLSDLPAGSDAEPYREDGFVGQQVTFESVPLSEFAGSGALSATGEDLSIVREGDEFHVSGGFDMSGEEFTGTEVPQEFLENFEFTIAITFPGEVVSATGDIDGNTVTWEPTIGENTRI
jgi:LppM domain